MPYVKVSVVMRTFILTEREWEERERKAGKERIKCGKRARQYSRILFI